MMMKKLASMSVLVAPARLQTARGVAALAAQTRAPSALVSSQRPQLAQQTRTMVAKATGVKMEGFFDRISNLVQGRAQEKQERSQLEMEKRLIDFMKGSDTFTLSTFRQTIDNSMKHSEEGFKYWMNKVPGVKEASGRTEAEAMLSVFDVMTTKELNGEKPIGYSEIERIATGAGVDVQTVQQIVHTHSAMQEVHRWIKHRQKKELFVPDSFKEAMKYMRVDREGGAAHRPPLWRIAIMRKNIEKQNTYRDDYGRRKRHRVKQTRI